MTDELKPNETRDALLRRKLTERAKKLGWKAPGPTSDYATWLLQKLLDMYQCDGLIGPNTSEAALRFAKPVQSQKHYCIWPAENGWWNVMDRLPNGTYDYVSSHATRRDAMLAMTSLVTEKKP
jgi:hypothetical protein